MSNNGFQARKCYDVLRVRALILENADEQTHHAAMQSYINALISGYNSAIGNTTEEALQLSAHCKTELKRLKTDIGALPRGLRFRGMAILWVPDLYHGLYRMHEAQVKRKIKAAAAKAQKE